MRALLFIVWLGGLGFAQQSSFVAHQNEMLALMERQKPKLERLAKEAKQVWAQVNEYSELLKYPKNVIKMRDSALVAVVALRKANDEVYYTAQDIWFQWFEYNMPLMAVYTRYGELIQKDRIDENLRAFLIRYRALDKQMQAILAQVKNTYNECDFLLSAKLK